MLLRILAVPVNSRRRFVFRIILTRSDDASIRMFLNRDISFPINIVSPSSIVDENTRASHHAMTDNLTVEIIGYLVHRL